MEAKHLCLLLVAVVASATVAAAQSDIDIPVENDNQFPPDAHPDDDVIQGSGNGAIEEPQDPTSTTTELNPPIEDIQSRTVLLNAETPIEENNGCPEQCTCHFESDNFVTDCSGQNFSEFPTPINPITTILKVHNNKLTEIPKEISSLKNVKILNASNNLIMELASGSISELPELVTLDLSNNRLLEYPKDLKNGFGLTNLQELILNGNDMRGSLDTDALSKFTSLRKLSIPSGLSQPQLEENICKSLKNVLLTICTEKECEPSKYDCTSDDTETDVDDTDLPSLPASIFQDNLDDDSDPSIPNENTESENKETPQENEINKDNTDNTASNTNASSTGEYSLRSAVIKEPTGISAQNSIVVAPSDTASQKDASDPNTSATTDKNNGGVSKSVIGIIVAGMVLVIAGITIKKNWSSIKKRFSSNSNSRTPNERASGNANGSAPEEVPLQDKSPV